ncbi:MAG TPA: hypothetical protein PKD51_16330 [Saprospiraceae bacterium]|nr:hypothetical protein [Saprospiraceae bacterium]
MLTIIYVNQKLVSEAQLNVFSEKLFSVGIKKENILVITTNDTMCPIRIDQIQTDY